MLFAGTNEAAIIEVVAHRTIAQRQLIKEAYKRAVGKVSSLTEQTGFFWVVVIFFFFYLKQTTKQGKWGKDI